MFTAKIRGIPIHKLQKSGFFPTIKVLAESWREHNCIINDPFTASKEVTVVLWFLAIIWLGFISLFGAVFASLAIGVFCLVLMVIFGGPAREAHSFVRAVRKLDTCLKNLDNRGIVVLPNSTGEIELFLREIMAQMVWHVLACEKTFGRESEEAEKWRQVIKEFCPVCAKFGVHIGKHDPYYDNAAIRLAKDKPPVGVALKAAPQPVTVG